MDFFSLKFAAFLGISLTAYHLTGSMIRRTVVFPLASILFIAGFSRSPLDLVPFFLFLMAGYVLVRIVQASRSFQKGALAIAALLLLFVYLKKYSFLSFLPSLPGAYMVIGISYVLFRLLHLLVDAQEGMVEGRIPLSSFFNYTCSFLTFVSGPIQRYQDYVEQERKAGTVELSRETVFAGFTRAANGYLKIGMISALLSKAHQSLTSSLQSASSLEFMLIYAAACLCYAAYLYFNFTGYMDVVIGIGRLFGFALPENFNRPFRSASFLEFWSRWHITLSEWFKFYVFNPLLKTLSHRWENPRHAPYLGVIAFFVVFLLMGIWHGSSYSFLLYGLFLGAGVSLNKLYEVEMRKRFGKARYNSLNAHPFYQALGGALALSYWSIALTCFWMDYGRITTLFLRLGFAGAVGVFTTGTAVVLLIMAVYSVGTRIVKRMAALVIRLRNNYLIQQGLLAAKVSVILLLIKMNAAPEFVYKAF